MCLGKIDSLGKRIKLLIQHYEVTQQEFADSCMMSSPNLSNLISGKVKDVGSGFLINLALKYRNVDVRWLLTGEGNMLMEDVAMRSNLEKMQVIITANQELIQNYTELTKLYNMTVQELMTLNGVYSTLKTEKEK